MTPSTAVDTDAWAHDQQIQRWRAMSDVEKWRLVDDLCRSVDALARAGIERDHPGASESKIRHQLLLRRFGADVATAAGGPSTDP